MDYLSPQFIHDLFVSYSHGDADGSGNSPLKTWSQAFVRELIAELAITMSPSLPRVFLDQHPRPERGLDPDDPLTQQLRRHAQGAALLLPLMSPFYVRSEWCRDERTWWLAKSATENIPEIGSRIFVARVLPTRDEDWPQEFCDERGLPPVGTWFHDKLGVRPFAWPDPSGAGGEFREALVELAGKIGKRLSEMNEAEARRHEDATNAAKLAAEGGQALYVHARARDKPLWESACDELISAGYGVAPDAPETDPSDPAQVPEDEIVKTLSACDALLLFPSQDGRSLSSDLTVVGHHRRNSARARKRKPLPCAVVDLGSSFDTKPRMQKSAQNLGINWIDASVPKWTDRIKAWLARAAQSQSGL